MNTKIFLEGDHVYLRPITEDDVKSVIGFFNDEMGRIYGSNSGSVMYEARYKEKLVDQQKKDEMFVICRKDNDEIIGDISIWFIDKFNRSGMLSIGIGTEDNRNKGYGREAILLILKHAFININLESINLGTYSYNERAIHVYEKIGFKNVGKRRHAKIIGNKYYDEIIMDMLSDEYFKLYGDNELEKYNLKD